ncbi:MAG: glycogen debranching enzyme N-terminal domain-containing protein [Verrucomicrobia bacterium]|nr:glycogen debranching enzyme N-terminal domain-containing protein [Verrucomicrobiota bacterium]
MTPLRYDPHAEWLEADGLGGFTSGTVSLERTRRYHALLLAAIGERASRESGVPAGRYVLINGLEVWLENAVGDRRYLSTQFYEGEVVQPRGVDAITDFAYEPWPRWVFRCGEGGPVVAHELCVVRDAALTLLSWRLLDNGDAGDGDNAAPPWRLHVRPLFSGRDYHSLQRQNPAFEFNPHLTRGRLTWKTYARVPAIHVWTDGGYRHDPLWYRNFLYRRERERGLDFLEDLASPGILTWPLSAKASSNSALDSSPQRRAVLAFAAEGAFDVAKLPVSPDAEPRFHDIIQESEAGRRADLARTQVTAPARAAGAYLMRDALGGLTINAGYPWFTDWGRDTFISLRGLCLATGRFAEAGEILLRWAGTVSEGMLPNRFPDAGQPPEYNSVDASLWFIIAACEYLNALRARGITVPAGQHDTLRATSEAILKGYAAGTRFGIRLDKNDGLLACGLPGSEWALTWMDARVGGNPPQPVTPRVGKPVEIQALWLNALHAIGAPVPASPWHDLFETGILSFQRRFYSDETGALADIVDCDHLAGHDDLSFRANQIFAVGGLPYSLLAPHEAVRVVAAVEEKLLTPFGLRTLAPGSAGYCPRYEGNSTERDGAYHQGTVWPWLLGPFVEAWVRVRGETDAAKAEARARFLQPLWERLHEAGLGHLPEIADAELPQLPRGCPFQAWSLGEALRLDRIVLRVDDSPPASAAPPKT